VFQIAEDAARLENSPGFFVSFLRRENDLVDVADSRRAARARSVKRLGFLPAKPAY